MKKLTKGLLSLNIAGAIRLARFGPNDARRRLAAAYQQIDPFGHGVGERHGPAPPRTASDLNRIPEVELAAVIRGRSIIGSMASAIASMARCPGWTSLALPRRAGRSCAASHPGDRHVPRAPTRLLALNLPSATIHTIDLPETYDAASNPSLIAEG